MTIRRIAPALTLLALTMGACGAPDREVAFQDDQEPAVTLSAAQWEDFRNEVRSSLEGIRMEVEGLAAATPGEERVVELARSTEETREEVMVELDRLATASADEARDIRRAASERLAELEAEVARNDVATSTTAEELSGSLEARLTGLSSDLEDLRQVAMDVPPYDPEAPPPATTDPAMTPPPAVAMDLSVEELAELEGRVAELRTVAMAAATAPQDELEDARDDLGDALADITREVRKHWYAARWNADA